MECGRISATKLQTYSQCPLKYHAVYELRIPERIFEATAIGSATHKIIEKLTNEKKIPDIRAICESYRISKDNVPLIISFVENTVKNGYFKEHRSILGVEMRFKNKLADGTTEISGIIDRLDRVEDHIRVIDLKTGKEIYTEDELQDSAQKKLYTIAASKMYPDAKAYEVIFWFIRQQVLQQLKADKSMAEQYENEVIELANIIRRDNDPQPKLNKYCNCCCYIRQCPQFKR